MQEDMKLTGYFAGALFSGQELYGNRVLADEITQVSLGTLQIDLPQDLTTQEAGDGREIRAADYLGMLQRDFVFANMNGPELDSGTVAEYVVASMLGMPRVQFRSDFRNVGDVPTAFPGTITICKTAAGPYNLMLGHDESVLVFAHSMALYKSSQTPLEFLRKLAVAAVRGIQLAFQQTQTASPQEYVSFQQPLARNLKLDMATVADILARKNQRQMGDAYRRARENLLALNLG
jgi:hypothetical protein